MIRLRQMSVFAHIVETGSITATADLLSLSKSVISQHLKSLETELGIILLKRTTRKQVLTSAGHEFYQHCRLLNKISEDAWLDIQNKKKIPQGKVRITAPNALMETLITPVIGDLLSRYPLLIPELISNDRHLDLMNEGIDLAIRVGRSQENSLMQRRIGEFKDVLCGNKNYISSNNDKKLAYISNTWQGNNIKHQFKVKNGDKKSDNIISYETKANCVTDSFHSCLALIKSSSGIGIVPDFYFKKLGNEFGEVFPHHQLSKNSVYALHTFGNKVPLNVEVCLNAIEQQLNITMYSK